MFGYRHTHADSACITSMSSSAYIHLRNNNIDFRYILYTVLFLHNDIHTQPITSHKNTNLVIIFVRYKKDHTSLDTRTSAKTLMVTY